MTSEKLRKKAKRVSKDMILINIAVVLLGVFLIIYPWGAKEIICRILGGLLAAWGVFRIFDYIITKSKKTNSIAGIIFGCVLLGIGVYVLIAPDFLVGILTALLSCIIFVFALLKLQYSLRFSREKSRLWVVQAVAAVIMMVTSVIAFINPFTRAGNFIMIFIGIALVINGIWDLLTIFYIKKFLSKTVDEVFSDTASGDQSKYVDTYAVDADGNVSGGTSDSTDSSSSQYVEVKVISEKSDNNQ